MLTSSLSGGAFKNISVQPDPGIPSTGDDNRTVVTFALYVWYNGGAGLTLAQALAAGDPWGVSSPVNINNLGGTLLDGNLGPPLVYPDLEGLESFSLSVVPEPATIALGIIGASTFLFRRRKTA
jgi:hypothetical protein